MHFQHHKELSQQEKLRSANCAVNQCRNLFKQIFSNTGQKKKKMYSINSFKETTYLLT